MKLKVIVSVIIAAAVGSQAYAMEITKGKLISHKEWATKGAKASSAAGTKTIQSLKSDGNVNRLSSAAYSETHTTLGTVGNPVSIKNEGIVYLHNETKQTYIYTILTHVCAESDISNNLECVNFQNKVSLEPGGRYFDNLEPTLTLTYHTPGSYHSSALTYYQSNYYPSEPGSDETATDHGYSWSAAHIIVS